jgi:S-DNA-T family DNA segregation ATPase FtsK/SpoIIIE
LLDLRRDGPHALVAGTTGADKTEFLREWIASLAATNHPDELTFILVDYKAEAAFGVFQKLPHTISVITEQDDHFTERMLSLLEGELRRREEILFATSATDIEEYVLLRDRRADLPSLPRLVVVVDEFASLVVEQPRLVFGLMETVRRGRLLGIHLVLGTQRPIEVMNSEVRATINLRIALRMANVDESIAVIGAPNAAYISKSQPGRAYVRIGADELVAIQTAKVDTGPVAADADRSITVRKMSSTGAIHGLLPFNREEPIDANSPTDIELLVDAIREAALLLAVPLLPQLLEEQVLLSQVAVPDAKLDLAPIAFGWEGVPEEQARRPAVLDLGQHGHLLVTGAPRSGRSQALRTLAAATARQHSTADVHLYGIDCGDGALQALTDLPHCGAVVTRSQTNRVARLFGQLTTTVLRRQQMLADQGFADLAEQRQAVPAARRLPYVLVLIDRWEGFVTTWGETDGGQLIDSAYRLLRKGRPVGVCLVVAGDRSLLTGRMRTLAEHKLILNLDDEADYSLAGLERHLIPVHHGPGRAFRADSGVEVQIALLDGASTRRGQTDALAEVAARTRERDAMVPQMQRPFRIDETPWAADQFHVGSGKGRPVGREDVLAWLCDLRTTGTCAALLGPRRAGKTWVLEELSRRLTCDNTDSIHHLVVPQPKSGDIDSPDALAKLLDRSVRSVPRPAEALLDKARETTDTDRLTFLLDEVGRLAGYDPAAVSWLRDLGQAGAWLVYTGTEKDWHGVVRWALTAPGSSFGNDVNARILGPLDKRAAMDFLTGTARNLGVDIPPDLTGAEILRLVGTWPFYLQVVGDAVVRAVHSSERDVLTDADALQRLVEQRLLDDWTHHFQARWAEIGPAGRAALLSKPGSVPSDVSVVGRQELRDVGLLRPGERWLSDYPFFAWIARNEISLRDGELHA